MHTRCALRMTALKLMHSSALLMYYHGGCHLFIYNRAAKKCHVVTASCKWHLLWRCTQRGRKHRNKIEGHCLYLWLGIRVNMLLQPLGRYQPCLEIQIKLIVKKCIEVAHRGRIVQFVASGSIYLFSGTSPMSTYWGLWPILIRSTNIEKDGSKVVLSYIVFLVTLPLEPTPDCTRNERI